MKSIFEKLNKMKLNVKDKFLSMSLKDTLMPDYQKSFNKKHFARGCSLDIKAEAEKKTEAVKNRAFELVNMYNKSPLALINYIEQRGYKVIMNSFAAKILPVIEEKPGFICGAKGIKALILNIISGADIGLKSKPMFILEDKPFSITEFLHDFYLWVAMEMGIPGFEPEVRKIFYKYFVKGEDSLLQHIQIKQMLMLKEAVSRDKEAIEFVIDFEKFNKNSKTLHPDDIPQKLFI